MKTNIKEIVIIIISAALLMSAGVFISMFYCVSDIKNLEQIIKLQDTKFKTLELENELLRVKIETHKNNLLECQENMGKIWEEATVVTDAYNLCKAQLNKRKKQWVHYL